MHNAALAELGLEWLYVPLPLRPERFEHTVRALPASGFRGLNVTVPHKLAAHELADCRTTAAAAIGAANTLSFADGRIEAHRGAVHQHVSGLGVLGMADVHLTCKSTRPPCRAIPDRHLGGSGLPQRPHHRPGRSARAEHEHPQPAR